MNDEIEVRNKLLLEKSKTIEKLIDNGYHQSSEHYKERIGEL
jgi:hypothetical protein